MKYYLGIDGGGTTTTAAVSDEKGKILFKKSGKTINFYSVGMEKAAENLANLMNSIYSDIEFDSFEAAFIGCSALDSEAESETIKALCGSVKADKIAMNSDLFIALRSLDCDFCPCVAVSGTGSMATGEDADGNIVISGGWGHIIGDEGSGYSIAVNALRRCCELCDEGIDSPLLASACEYFSVDNFRKAIDIIYSPETSKDIIAGFAASVGKLCDTDGDSRAIVISEAHRFAGTVIILLNKIKSCSVLGLYGGIFRHNSLYTQAFTEAIKNVYPQIKTQLLNVTPEEGALRLARNL